MMVTWVRGLFKDVHGRLDLEWDRCVEATFEGAIDAAGIWTGEPQRDEHLRSADFLDAENHPKITVAGRFTERTGSTTFKGEVDLTIRGVTRTVPLDIVSLGEWKTPFWVGEENKGELLRIGFEGGAKINRHDFGVSWQDEIPGRWRRGRQRDRTEPRCRGDSARRTRTNRRNRVLPTVSGELSPGPATAHAPLGLRQIPMGPKSPGWGDDVSREPR